MESEDRSMRLLFIVNPISGVGAGKRVPRRVKKMPEYRGINYDILFTEYAGHGRMLVEAARNSGTYTHIIAVGGDGTVNEVGTALYGSDIAFGIISLGSGNGFARHLGYSVFMKKALKQVLSDSYEYVDMLEVNGVLSLNVSGIGYDAEVAHEFNRFKIRGVVPYILSGMKMWFRYPEKEYKITCDGQERHCKCFIMSFANSSQYGNNASIAPYASLIDGKMDICILKRPPFWSMIRFLFFLMNSGLNRLNYYEDIQCEEALIEGDICKAHIDGDATILESPVRLKVHKGVLKVVVP